MKDFDYWKKRYESQQLEEFNDDDIGLLWLKIKSIGRVDIIKSFIDKNNININQKLNLEKKFEELFIFLCKDIEHSNKLLDNYIKLHHKYQVDENNLDIKQLVSELDKLESFNWGGDYRNSLDKYLISQYVKIPLYIKWPPDHAPSFSYDVLDSRFEKYINIAVKNYVLSSWYNHWSSILIENIFTSHPCVLPAVGQIKSVDFFINDIPFDLKVTYLPVEYIKLKRKEKGLPVELTFLKKKAAEANINFDEKAKKKSDTYHEIVEKMKDRNDDFCNSVLSVLKKEKLQILKEAQSHPKMLAKWLYEKQGEMRFGSENRLFLVLVDSEDFTG